MANSADLFTPTTEHEPCSIGTHTEDEGTVEDIFRFEDDVPDWSTGFDSSEWEVSDGEDGADTGWEKQFTDKKGMFKLKRFLGQLDTFYQQKKLNLLQAREELKAFQHHVTELEENRDKIELDIEREKQAENSVALLRLRAQHKRVCAELQVEEDLGTHLAMILKEHELELCQVEVELGHFMALRQELELEEKNVQSQDMKKQTLRLQREKSIIKQRRHKEQDKIERDKVLQQQAEVHRKQQEQALASHLKAAVYLKQTLQRMKQKEAEAEERRKELIKKRQTAVMTLKASFAASQETMLARKQKQKAYEQKQREQEQHLKESLEAKGLNSTEHIHRLRLQERFHKKKEEFEDTQRVGKMEIVAKLLSERNMKERGRKSPVPSHEKKRDEKLLLNVLPSTAHMREEKLVISSPRASCVRSNSDSDVSSSSDSAELMLGECVEVEDEDKTEMILAKPEFTGLWEHKHKDDMATSDENIHLETSSTIMKNDMNKDLVSKAANKTIRGRESKGPPFISKPEMILFKDCEVGKVYKKKVTLTNVTYMTNYCKLSGVSQNLKDHVSVSFEPPGPMSAGMACELEAIFRPLLDVDLDGEIHFLSATGPFSVAIKCSKKTCEMVVDHCLVDFGTHVVGQTVSRVITMTNRGALGTRYTLKPVSTRPLQQTFRSTRDVQDSGSLEMPSLNAENTAEIPSGLDLGPGVSPVNSHSPDEVSMADPGSVELSTFEPSEFSIEEAHEGDVGPFVSVKIPITFTPTIPGEAKLDFQIMFSQPGCEPIVVSVCGVAESAPVWVTKPNIDLKICMYDRLYQDSIEVQSRASSALRLTFKVCKEMRNHLSVVPKTGFIQAKSSFSAQLKFLPRPSLYADAGSFFNKDTGVLEVPLTLQVADQVRPVRFTLHAVVTSSDLLFDRTEVDFGHCSVYESSQTSVRLTNCSLLPQEFGFVGIPKFIDVQPNDGFGTLLPSQSLDIYLIFSASKAGEYNFTLTCKTGINRDFLLSCHATGVQPSLKLSDCLVEFGGTALGDRTTAVLYVENHIISGPEATARLFAFSVPENSDITITPTSGRVLPGQRCLLQVTFSPTLSDDVIKAEALRRRSEFHTDANSCQHTQPDSKSKMETQLLLVKDQGSKVTPANSSPVHSPSSADVQAGSNEYLAAKTSLLRSFTERRVRHVISCFTLTSDTPEEPRYSPHETLYLELHCPSVRPALLLVSDRRTISFSQVAVGQKVLKKVIIQNISSEFVKLTSSLLDVSGPFSVLNAMRSVAPEDTHVLLVACKPSVAKKYYETLVVSCSQMSLEIALSAEAVDPIITCSHEGHIDFDHVPEGESASQVFRLQNLSSLDVRFGVLLDSQRLTEVTGSTAHVGAQNHSGMSVFRVSPSGGAISPAAAADITVTFHPDHESLHYRDVLRVQLMNKQTVCVLELRGSSCRHNMFVSGGDPVEDCSESLIPSHIYTSQHQDVDSRSLLLTFTSEFQEGKAVAATRKLNVGHLLGSKPASKKTLEFIWENLSPVEQQGFRVAPTQGSVDAGHRRPITITWMPSSGLAPNAVVEACALLTVRGDETALYRVVMMARTDRNT